MQETLPGSIPGLGRSVGEGIGYPLQYSSLENSRDCLVHGVARVSHNWATFTSFQSVKNLPAVQETWVQPLDWEDTLEKEMSIHSSSLVWSIPWTEEPGGLQSPVSPKLDTSPQLTSTTEEHSNTETRSLWGLNFLLRLQTFWIPHTLRAMYLYDLCTFLVVYTQQNLSPGNRNIWNSQGHPVFISKWWFFWLNNLRLEI